MTNFAKNFHPPDTYIFLAINNRIMQPHSTKPKHAQARSSVLSLAVFALFATPQQTALADTSSTPSDTLQVSPLGFSGAINTPTADVLPVASTVFSITNSIPERARKYPGVGVFGGLNWGFGVLPGLELVGRLTYDGNVQCNEFDRINCATTSRDLSLSGKYQLPLSLPLNTRMAMGFTDYGGAATNYRQLYAVGTTSHGPVDASLGYSSASSQNSLLKGTFGNLTLRVNDQLAMVFESDTQARRIGMHYLQPLTDDIDLQMGLSRKLSGPAYQQANQFTVALRYQLDKKIKQASQKKKPVWSANDTDSPTATLDQRAVSLANRMAADGFSNIHIAALPAADGQPIIWWIQADPVGWRKDHQQALGAGLVNWMLNNEAEDAEVVLSLTYMGQPTSSVHTSRSCVGSFALGHDTCSKALLLRFFSGAMLPQRLQSAKPGQMLTLVSNAASYAWKPQFELGASIRSTTGTEYGLADFSAALDIGAQMQLGNITSLGDWGKGWMWQGNVLVPVARSEDFDKGGVFHQLGHTKTEVDQALMSYMRVMNTPLANNVAVQASVGAINSYSRGSQLDAVWINPLGDWRVGGTLGVYSLSNAAGMRSTETPALLSIRHSVMAGQWQLEGTVGKFLGGDTGYKASSHHWFGDYRLSFFIRESKGNTAAMSKKRFAGFEISMPLGPKGSTETSWGNVRGQDRFAWGTKTKIGESNNRQTFGYGEVPMPRHGVWTDITNHDRSGALDMWANRQAMRAALQQDKQ